MMMNKMSTTLTRMNLNKRKKLTIDWCYLFTCISLNNTICNVCKFDSQCSDNIPQKPLQSRIFIVLNVIHDKYIILVAHRFITYIIMYNIYFILIIVYESSYAG